MIMIRKQTDFLYIVILKGQRERLVVLNSCADMPKELYTIRKLNLGPRNPYVPYDMEWI